MDKSDEKAAQHEKEIDPRPAELKKGSERGSSEIRGCSKNGCAMAGEHQDGGYATASLNAR
jgi:hypothetical protein